MTAFDTKDFEKYKSEAKEKWGQTESFKEYGEKTKNYTEQKWSSLACYMDRIMAEFAECKKKCAPDSSIAQALVKKLQSYITDNYYTCTNEILACLGKMYVADERFKKNIDKHGDGTAEFLSSSIEVYCHK